MFVNQNLLYELRLKIPEGQSCHCVSSKQIEMQTCRPACRTRTSGPEPRFWVTLILSWRKPFKIVMLPYQQLSSWASLFLLSISKFFKCVATHDVTIPHCTTFHRYTPRVHRMRFRICKQFKGWRDQGMRKSILTLIHQHQHNHHNETQRLHPHQHQHTAVRLFVTKLFRCASIS